jgi:hypothetical protein
MRTMVANNKISSHLFLSQTIDSNNFVEPMNVQRNGAPLGTLDECSIHGFGRMFSVTY